LTPNPESPLFYYGILGEGWGHFSRACVLVPELLEAGYGVRLFSSGEVLDALRDRFPECLSEATPQPRFTYRDNALDLRVRLLPHLALFCRGLAATRRCAARMRREQPLAVVSDFEPIVARAAAWTGTPLIALDHQQVISEYDVRPAPPMQGSIRPVCRANRMAYPRPAMRIVSSFFYPRLRGGYTARTTRLVGPLLRKGVLARAPRNEGHVVVYQTSPTLHWLDSLLDALPGEKRVYGAAVQDGPGIVARQKDETTFLDDLASCRFAVVNGGHTAITEALHFGKPLICLPVRRQAEQEINALWVSRLGFGRAYWPEPGEIPDFTGFLAREALFRRNIRRHGIPCGNDKALRLLREFLSRS